MDPRQDAETAFEVARSSLEIAEFNLRYATIKAPANGKIMKRFAEANELIAGGQPVFLFASKGKEWIVRAGLAEQDIVNLQAGDSAAVTFGTYPGESFRAYVTELAEGIDPRSGTFEVELTLAEAPARLISGFTANLTIYPSRTQEFALLPVEALIVEAIPAEAEPYGHVCSAWYRVGSGRHRSSRCLYPAL